MKAEPFIIDKCTWCTVWLHESQEPIGQVNITVNTRPDGSFAKDPTGLDAQEEFIFSLVCRNLRRSIEALYKPDSFRWVWEPNEAGHCNAHLIPVYTDELNHSFEHEEIGIAIQRQMYPNRFGRT